MSTKSKFQSLSARRSSPRTPSGSLPETISSPRTCSRFLLEPNSFPKTNEIPRTPFSFGAITPVSGTLKSVSLSDWWLTKKANEKGLCISGYESKGGSEVRLFSSGTISERHDSTTLKTFDGITVSITGFINQSRTLQNGISLEICNRFLLGFPYDWKDYNEEESIQKYMNNPTDFSFSFDDIPVSSLQDVLLTSSPCFKSKILDGVVSSLRDFTYPKTQKSHKKCEKSDMKCEKSDKESEKSRISNDDESLVRRDEGVKTRSMLKRRQDNEISVKERVRRQSPRRRLKDVKFLLN